jgi:hypothetical protein
MLKSEVKPKKQRPFKFKTIVENMGHGMNSANHMEDVLKKHIGDLVSGKVDYIKECASPGNARYYELCKIVSPLAFCWSADGVRGLTGDLYLVHGNSLIKMDFDHGNCYGYIGIARLNNPNKPTRWDEIKLRILTSRNPGYRYRG